MLHFFLRFLYLYKQQAALEFLGDIIEHSFTVLDDGISQILNHSSNEGHYQK